jgi:RNA polymerase subunit RPABC4/transcription elongation factor Spt4
MDQRSKWIVFALVIASVVVVGCLILALLGAALGWGASGSSVPLLRGDRMRGMCPWCGGRGVHTPWGSVGGVVIALFVVALPLGLIALLIVGGVWLARSAQSTPSPRDESLVCPSCGEEVEPGWKACPNCGERLAE